MLEDTHIHHNQLGVSLEWVRSVLIENCRVFSNRSWGIYMRNSNVATVQGNGNLLVGKAYTAMLDLKPGDEFTIKLSKKCTTLFLQHDKVDKA